MSSTGHFLADICLNVLYIYIIFAVRHYQGVNGDVKREIVSSQTWSFTEKNKKKNTPTTSGSCSQLSHLVARGHAELMRGKSPISRMKNI